MIGSRWGKEDGGTGPAAREGGDGYATLGCGRGLETFLWSPPPGGWGTMKQGLGYGIEIENKHIQPSVGREGWRKGGVCVSLILIAHIGAKKILQL